MKSSWNSLFKLTKIKETRENSQDIDSFFEKGIEISIKTQNQWNYYKHETFDPIIGP
jgi:hypothetical protein